MDGSDIYLLGRDKENTYYWLEEPSWSCGWYWGFGYISTSYSHQHREGTLQKIKNPMYLYGYTDDKLHTYINNPYDNPYLIEKTFDKNEGWELAELFNQFYFLKEAAEMFKRGKAHIANTTIPLWKDPKKAIEINNELIPIVTARILEILTPNK